MADWHDLLKEMLGKVGIDVTLYATEGGVFTSQVMTGKFEGMSTMPVNPAYEVTDYVFGWFNDIGRLRMSQA